MNSLETKKSLRFKIILDTGRFGSSDLNVIELKGFRASVEIDKSGGVQMSTMRAKIFGVSKSDMQSITTMQWSPDYSINNKIEAYAIDGAVETIIFSGHLIQAVGDYQSIPDVFLSIQAALDYDARMAPTAPISVAGGSDVALLIDGIAKALGKKLENNSNLHVTLVDVYESGSLIDQLYSLANAADINVYIESDVIAITPRNTPRESYIPLISPESGLVGYPTFDATGVVFRCLFNPAIIFGGAIKLDSSLSHANGQWVVDSVGIYLESEKSGGAWFSNVRASLHGGALKTN